MRIFKSLIGVILSIVFFWVIFTLSYWVLALIEGLRSWVWLHQGDFLRMLSKIIFGSSAYPSEHVIGSRLLDLFINLMAAGFGAYLAMLGVYKILKESYSKKFVLYGFSVFLILFAMRSLILMISVAKQAGFGIYDFSIQILTPIIAIGAAHFATGRK